MAWLMPSSILSEEELERMVAEKMPSAGPPTIQRPQRSLGRRVWDALGQGVETAMGPGAEDMSPGQKAMAILEALGQGFRTYSNMGRGLPAGPSALETLRASTAQWREEQPLRQFRQAIQDQITTGRAEGTLTPERELELTSSLISGQYDPWRSRAGVQEQMAIDAEKRQQAFTKGLRKDDQDWWRETHRLMRSEDVGDQAQAHERSKELVRLRYNLDVNTQTGRDRINERILELSGKLGRDGELPKGEKMELLVLGSLNTATAESLVYGDAGNAVEPIEQAQEWRWGRPTWLGGAGLGYFPVETPGGEEPPIEGAEPQAEPRPRSDTWVEGEFLYQRLPDGTVRRKPLKEALK